MIICTLNGSAELLTKKLLYSFRVDLNILAIGFPPFCTIGSFLFLYNYSFINNLKISIISKQQIDGGHNWG